MLLNHFEGASPKHGDSSWQRTHFPISHHNPIHLPSPWVKRISAQWELSAPLQHLSSGGDKEKGGIRGCRELGWPHSSDCVPVTPWGHAPLSPLHFPAHSLAPSLQKCQWATDFFAELFQIPPLDF